MALVRPLTDEEIPEDVAELAKFFGGPLGMFPNSVRTMARRPEIAKALTMLNQAVMVCEHGVTPEFKRIIAYIASATAGCRYCQAHTALGAKRFGANDARLETMWSYANSPHFTQGEKAALDFAVAASTVPNSITPEIEENLRRHWSDGEIVEILAVISLFGFLNRWNDSMASTLEDGAIEVASAHLIETGWEVGKHR